MKTTLITILIISFYNFNLFSQSISVKLGSNISHCKVGERPMVGFTSEIAGFNFGIYAEKQLKNKVSLETGLAFSQKGYTLTNSSDTLRRLTYIDIPVNLRYGFNIKNSKLFIIAGSYIGFGIYGIKKYKDEDNEKYFEKLKFGNKNSDDFKRLDYGLNLGAEYCRNKWGVGFQYCNGLADIANENYLGSLKNIVLNFYIKYQIINK